MYELLLNLYDFYELKIQIKLLINLLYIFKYFSKLHLILSMTPLIETTKPLWLLFAKEVSEISYANTTVSCAQ